MFSPTRTALCIAICAAMGLAASEANAGCKIISGTKYCASWITGSEICEVGIDSNQIPIGSDGTAMCIVHGNGGPSGDYDFSCNDANLTGTQTCGSSSDSPTLANASTNTTNNSSNNNNGWQGNNPARQGPKCDHDKKNKNPACNPPDLGGGTLESPTVPLTCNNQGICTAIAEVGVPDGATCGSGGTLLDFTADDFIGIVVFDGGEGNGQTLLFQHCTLTQQCGPGQGSYTCTDITDDVDQDSCGFYSD
jgi:hypothetical protein